MVPATSRKRLLRAVLGAMLGAAVLIGDMGTSARADDDDEAFDVKILRDILRTLGLRRGDGDGIEYRERSPLVVPPSRNLAPPVTAKSTETNSAWPNDPDVKRRKEAKAKNKDRRSIDWDADTRPLGPNALRGNGSGTNNQAPTNNSNPDGNHVMKPSELGYKGGLFSSIFGAKEEYTTFTGEQPRTNLIEPPTGYRTPSPNQPYGVGKEKWVPKGPVDRHEPVR